MPFTPLHRPPADADGAPLTILVGPGSVTLADGEGPEGDALFLGVLDGRPCWAVDVDLPGGTPLMGLYGSVDDLTWTIAGRAVQLVEWTRTHRFCGRCATPTVALDDERAMRCPACGLMAFPRLAPAIITLVTRDDGRALLGRGRAFPVPMWSCLAGFVEPGETLEEAVHREVGEEVGIALGDVRYWGSQPWPFPHSLMIGFRARWADGDIVCDETEIVDAGWYEPTDLPPIPPGLSIARRMIDEWVAAAT